MAQPQTASENVAWNLEAFLNSLIYELDRANQALTIKQDNVKLTYTVQDLSVTLQIFPQYDGETVRFVTAQPGEVGASTMTFQLGSIRDTQIRELARRVPSRDDTSIDAVELPESERRTLKQLGINTAEDLRRTVEDRGVDIEQLTDRKVSYRNLAEIINRTRRQRLQAPVVRGVSLSMPANGGAEALLSVHGEKPAGGAAARRCGAGGLPICAAGRLAAAGRIGVRRRRAPDPAPRAGRTAQRQPDTGPGPLCSADHATGREAGAASGSGRA
jgi:hypothetical protein